MKIITMNHTIEHLVDPEKVIKKLKNKVRTDGIIDGQTPVTDSFEKKLFKKYWSGFHSPRHTVIFSKDGLKNLSLRLEWKKLLLNLPLIQQVMPSVSALFFLEIKKLLVKDHFG